MPFILPTYVYPSVIEGILWEPSSNHKANWWNCPNSVGSLILSSMYNVVILEYVLNFQYTCVGYLFENCLLCIMDSHLSWGEIISTYCLLSSENSILIHQKWQNLVTAVSFLGINEPNEHWYGDTYREEPRIQSVTVSLWHCCCFPVSVWTLVCMALCVVKMHFIIYLCQWLGSNS